MKKFLTLLFLLTFFLFPSDATAQIITSGKLITVDRGKQMLYAWEGGKIVFQSPVSTGMYYTPTVKGSFKIYRKLPLQNMKGSYPPYEPYFIKNVPNVMYFYGAYAIHGTFWHNSFGTRASHGCVNLPVAASQWVYNFADVGTRVEVF
ncbi:MAG TPA: L,D-transpeptidase [Candidatus Limnocylindrales bacterium]|nr:L,D-transpeptidase [Candidatus Limnocylindrales bacterium]